MTLKNGGCFCLRWVVFVAIACKLAYPDRLKEA